MKVISLVSVACIMFASSAALAAPMSSFEADTTVSLYQDHARIGTSYDRCHGRASGTSDPACGSLTGGPAGGLF